MPPSIYALLLSPSLECSESHFIWRCVWPNAVGQNCERDQELTKQGTESKIALVGLSN